MANEQGNLEGMVETLERVRDEVKLQMHLARKEAKDEWERLEDEWKNFQVKVQHVREASSDTAEEVRAAARMLGNSLKEGYDRIRQSFSS